MTLNGVRAAQHSSAADDDLAVLLAKLAAVVADEASCNAEFRARLSEVLLFRSPNTGAPAPDGEVTATDRQPNVAGASKIPTRRGRRAPGPWDPYAVYGQVGEQGLKERLAGLELEQLRDIVAEHGMNHDGKAMRWKAADRVIGRIVERVVERAGKGDAFRSA